MIGGKVLLLDRDDINTDEIIPAKYLTEVDKKNLAPYILEDLKLNNFDPKKDTKDKKVVLTRKNFGCGSSREHAVWVFTENDYKLIIAEGFARIFRQNAYNSGLLVVELPKDKVDRLIELYKKDPDIEIYADIDNQIIVAKSKNGEENIKFDISPLYKEIVKEGGWIGYVDKKY
ncbi:MAG TPA: 3-isopropylmalate dehydratase small subunit [Spirochaetota bacterium]|nr:3-isopropylmalate dehydratase small subunit [Spirochaetota bacterium]HOM38288.1 3-isopropylmalate dehydratase small subunit [Spirochaetota bacterium]HPQ48494.1 3-isopropylmalate dehydratase small subunit [Spirochaetota bacterium]